MSINRRKQTISLDRRLRQAASMARETAKTLPHGPSATACCLRRVCGYEFTPMFGPIAWFCFCVTL